MPFWCCGLNHLAEIYTVFLLVFIQYVLLQLLVGQNNLAYPFWAFVFPHGSLELPAIFFAGVQ